MFEIEKLAVDYCRENGIDDYSPVRGQVISAFCCGAKIEREACAKFAEDFNTFPCGISTVGKVIAAEMRVRSNAKVSGERSESAGLTG